MPGGGQTTQPTQTSTFQMSPEQRKLFDLAFPGVKDFAQKDLQYAPGGTVQGFDPSQVAGQNMALKNAGQQNSLAQAGAANSKFLMGDIWNPASNPNLQGAINASIAPITEAYQRNIMPGITDEFQGAGQQFGGSRQGVAQGIAADQYMNTVGETASKLVQDQYKTNMDANLKALGLLPQTTQNLMAGALTTSGVGDVRQRQAQAELTDDVNRFNFDQYGGYNQSRDIMGLIGGIPGGTNTSTANNPPQAPWWQQALGAGMAGSQIYSNMGGAGGVAALLPFLAASDRRLKKNIERIGKLPNGLPVYRFQFKSGGPMQIGLMADDVEKLNPSAVYTMANGYKAVDYDAAVRSKANG